MEFKYLNLRYAFVNIGFLMLFAGSMGYAYNFLSQSGFDDATIGTVMSVISLLGVFAGPAAGDLVDRSPKITQKMFISASMVLCGAGALLLLVIPAGSPLILPLVVVSFMSASVGMPLLNSMAFIYEKAGGVINYGLCRGLGSAAYAIASNIVGRLWAVLGAKTLPFWVVAGAALTFFAVNLMPEAPTDLALTDDEPAEPEAEGISIFQFFGKYRDITLVVLSLMLMYFCHFIINNYMAKVIGMFVSSNVETVQGNAMFIAAMLELPAMFGFSFILKRFDVSKIIAVASVLYSVKHVLTFACANVPMFYGAMALQMVSYAALVPAVVYFANEHVAEEDRNKGQAVFATASTIGGLLASFLGGWLFTYIPVRAVLGIGAAASVGGTALMIFALRKMAAKGE